MNSTETFLLEKNIKQNIVEMVVYFSFSHTDYNIITGTRMVLNALNIPPYKSNLCILIYNYISYTYI